MTENPGRDVDALRDMEAAKREYQIRCSHVEIALSANESAVACESCGKTWLFKFKRGYAEHRRIFVAER